MIEETEFIIEDENELTSYSYINNGYYFEYFVGYEIASLLEYKNTRDVIIKNVSKCNQLVFRDFPGVKMPELDPRTILITSDGVIEILLKTRKRISPDVLHILKKFNIETTNRKCLTKEQQTLSAITNAFKTEKFEDQYKIGKYYLDLYFSEHKIVIECDENGHADRKPYNERERMDFVNKQLYIDDSYWIRYNPDEHDFDISKVIGKIYRKIDEINKQYIKSLEEKTVKKRYRSTRTVYQESEESPHLIFIDNNRTNKKKCTNCLIELPLYKFYLKNVVVNEEDFNLDNEDENEKYKELKYRSRCKKCYNKETQLLKEKVKNNPNYSKNHCVKCDTLLKLDMFYKNEDETSFDLCINCYKTENNLDNCKQCNKCRNILSFSKFQLDSSHKDGHRSQCKDCRNKQAMNSRQKRLSENDEKVICEFCNKIISNKNNLNIHQKTKNCKEKQNNLVS